MSKLNIVRALPFAPDPGFRDVVVIGGGASGVLMAAQLLSRSDRVRVTLIEGRHLLGCGVAYSTSDADHLLNTRAHNMSAYADRPHHFLDWLSARQGGAPADPDSFIGRSIYGSYLTCLLSPWEGSGRLACLKHVCLDLVEDAAGVTFSLENGPPLRADLAVLATGHVVPPPDPEGLVTGAWDRAAPPDPDGRVVIVGTGLSMVDQVLSLLNNGHRGKITALSRRGLMPRSHAATRPLKIAADQLPDGTSAAALLAFVRGLARQAEAAGGTWRDAVDGIRNHVTTLWQRMPLTERRRFLRHGVTWWDVHRHRIPPASAERIGAAIASGQLEIRRGSFAGARKDGTGILARWQPRQGKEVEEIAATMIIDCRGIRNDPVQNASPLMAKLMRDGRARPDPLRIGMDVSDDCRLIGADGTASRRILAIGPVSRAAFWEITAIPDIREQVAWLASRLLEPVSD